MNQIDTAKRISTLKRIRKFTYLMDSAFRIPIINFRFGLDPIIGLVPGAGDLVSTGFSAYILYLAARFNLPAPIFRQMVFNVALEAIIGTVPLVGDLFDAYYKSNIRNLALLEQHLGIADSDPQVNQHQDLTTAELATSDRINT